MNIRLANTADAESIVQFNQAMAFETEQKRLDPAVVGPAVAAVFDDAGKGFYVVAEDDNKVVGALMITYEWSDWRNAWFWWIQSVYISPEARGKKIYTRLYTFVKEMAREDGNVYGIRLYVENDNSRAQRIYERVGMEQSNYLMYDESL